MDISLNEHNHDAFLANFPFGAFLQSRFWKDFLKLQGKKAWQLAVYEKRQLIAHCLLYSTKLPFSKSYLYAPKGPFVLPTLSATDQREAFELILSQIRDITIATRKREELFCRIEPNVPAPELSSIAVRKIPAVQPSTTIYREITESPEKLLASFKEKTRYNIRLAEKKGVTVHWSNDQNGLKIFQQLLGKSARRQKIKTHDKHYYAMLFEAGRKHNTIAMNWAEYEGRPIAANVYILFQPTVTYVHGGFDYRQRHLMAPYLLQWEAMKLAHEKGFRYYDFWGYLPNDGSKPAWAGFSRFKEGFSGTVVEMPGAYEFIYNPVWYEFYARAKRFLR